MAQQVMTSQGLIKGPGSYILSRDTTGRDITNTTSELSIWSTSGISIPAGIMGTDKMLRVTALCDWKYLISNVTLNLKLKFGGTTLWENGAIGTASFGGQVQPWWMTFYIANLGVANSQFVEGTWNTKEPQHTAPTTGFGKITDLHTGDAVRGGSFSNTAAIDTASAQTLDFTATWASADTNHSFRSKYIVTELV